MSRWRVAQLEAQASQERSYLRRQQAARRRRNLRFLALPATGGLALLALYCGLLDPVGHWYLAIVGIGLILPFLVRWMDDE